jgi:hypothetical protein
MSFSIIWISTFVFLLILCWYIGLKSKFQPYNNKVKNIPWSILIDARGRISLNRFQIVLWSLLILSTFSAIFFTHLNEATNLAFNIPEQLLILMGISVSSTVVSSVVKNNKNITNPQSVGGSSDFGFGKNLYQKESENDSPKPFYPTLSHMFLEEEGRLANQIISITKFQNFLFTIFICVAFTILSIQQKGYPDINDKLLWLIAISHSGYIAGKLPQRN